MVDEFELESLDLDESASLDCDPPDFGAFCPYARLDP